MVKWALGTDRWNNNKIKTHSNPSTESKSAQWCFSEAQLRKQRN